MMPNAVLVSQPRSPHFTPSGVANCYTKSGTAVSDGSEQSILEFKSRSVGACLSSWVAKGKS